jgi:hypothetical protein
MASGLFPDIEIIERFLASVTTGSMVQPFVAPCDLDIVGLVASVATAPGSTNLLTVNISNSPTSQISVVSAYNLWTTANAPGILGTATKSFSAANPPTVIKNVPYALNYPLPGPSGASGYVTSQSASQTTQSPVVAPPSMTEYGITSGIVAPDNVYNDLNGISQPASWVHAGDILTFVLSGTAGSAASISISLYASKH